jgi:hypothetical protein
VGRTRTTHRFFSSGSFPLKRIILLASALALSPTHPANAQEEAADTIIYGVRAPGWAGQISALGTNVLVGGLTAGLWQELRGGSFKDGFTRGALGGAFNYAGKRVAGRKFDGAGLVGRELAAVGSSVIRNASEGRPTFQQLSFPLGPLRLHVRPSTWRFDASLDVVSTLWLAWGIAEPELEFSTAESFSAGAPVFRTNNRLIVHRASRVHGGGFTLDGVILQSYVPAWGKPFLQRALAHERIHVIQADQISQSLIEPGAEWLLSRIPHGTRIGEQLDFNLSTELLGVLSRLFDRHADRPWELEAIYLSR